jgi:hypothetical protein
MEVYTGGGGGSRAVPPPPWADVLHLLEFVRHVVANWVGAAPPATPTCTSQATGQTSGGTPSLASPPPARNGEPASQRYTVRLPREASDWRIQRKSGDALMLVAGYRRRHTPPVAAQRTPPAHPSRTRQAHRMTEAQTGPTGGAAPLGPQAADDVHAGVGWQ